MSEERDEAEQAELAEIAELDEAPYDAGDRRHVKKREVIAKRLESSERMVLRQVMGSREGRAWMHKMMTMCHIYSTSFSRVALDMAYLEGERNVGLRLSADVIAACPERYMEMMKEANGDE